jgi:hypothetical protein
VRLDIASSRATVSTRLSPPAARMKCALYVSRHTGAGVAHARAPRRRGAERVAHRSRVQIQPLLARDARLVNGGALGTLWNKLRRHRRRVFTPSRSAEQQGSELRRRVAPCAPWRREPSGVRLPGQLRLVQWSRVRRRVASIRAARPSRRSLSDLKSDVRQTPIYTIPNIPFRIGFLTIGYTYSDIRASLYAHGCGRRQR